MSGRKQRPQLFIRPLETLDAEAMARLQAMPGYRFGTLRPPYPTIASAGQFLEKLGPDDLLLGAFVGHRLVGTAGLHRQGGRRRHVAVLGVGVADDLNGRGIGSALIAALLDAADKWLDLRRIELSVFADNERAIRLYERFGFAREGIMRAYAFRDGRYADGVMMARLRGL